MKRILLVCFLIPLLSSGQISYPVAKVEDQKDDYFGTYVKDPYRWMEDDKSKEVTDWAEAENKLTFSYLDKIPFRTQLRDRLEKLYDYARYGTPFHKGNQYYFYKNDGLQNQSVLYRQDGPAGKPEVVIDPNILSSDGTTRIQQFKLSRDGSHAAYAISKGGSDWEEIYVMDMKTLKQMSDHLEWIKISNIAWQGDGFYYSRYPAPDKGKELSTKNENHQVYYHAIGTTQDQDQLIYEDRDHPLRFNELVVSDDEKYIFLSSRDKGAGYNGNALFYKTKEDKHFKDIQSEYNKGGYDFICTFQKDIILLTGHNAKNLRVIKFDPETDNERVVVDESDPIQYVRTAGGKLFVCYLIDAHEVIRVYTMNGLLENEIQLPGAGTVGGFYGYPEDKEVFYTFSSFTSPTTIYSYNIADKTSKLFRKPDLKFDPDDFVTDQVFYPSKDGTIVPMYITHRKDMKRNGANPVLLYAYGGFSTSVTPIFNSHLIPFLEAGGVYVSANIRGGGEYGDAWHKAGSRRKKQNSFDDFIYAAKYLIKKKYTSSQHLAIRGTSNGGILIGAVCNQHPELFKVAIAQAGVMDMLRFHKFTIGWNWRSEYGTPDVKEDFDVLYSYSPLHNIKSGIKYPAMMVTTADHDDRVVPAHSYKYIATLQATAGQSTQSPLLLRIEANSGHGASSTQKNIDIQADVYSFIFYNMGITPSLSK